MNKHLLLGLLGFISGSLSYWGEQYFAGDVQSQYFNFGLSYLPGIIFGIAIGFCMLYISPRNWKLMARLLSWVLISTFSYAVAVNVTLSFDKLIATNSEIGSFFAGGIVGTSLMLLGFHLFVSKLQLKEFIGITLHGGVLSLSWFLKDTLNSLFVFPYQEDLAFFALYICWQTGMALGLSFIKSLNQPKPVSVNISSSKF